MAAHTGDALLVAFAFALGVHLERWRNRRARKREEAVRRSMSTMADRIKF